MKSQRKVGNKRGSKERRQRRRSQETEEIRRKERQDREMKYRGNNRRARE